MERKRSIQEIKKSEFVNFSELALLANIPRRTLSSWSDFDLLVSIDPGGNKRKLYPRVESMKIISLFQAELNKGFKRKFAALNMKKSVAYKNVLDNVERIAEKYEWKVTG